MIKYALEISAAVNRNLVKVFRLRLSVVSSLMCVMQCIFSHNDVIHVKCCFLLFTKHYLANYFIEEKWRPSKTSCTTLY